MPAARWWERPRVRTAATLVIAAVLVAEFAYGVFLRDNDFPALRELSYNCETPSTASFGELASIIASPAFPDLRSLDTDHTEAAIFAPTAKRASAFDKHCIQ